MNKYSQTHKAQCAFSTFERYTTLSLGIHEATKSISPHNNFTLYIMNELLLIYYYYVTLLICCFMPQNTIFETPQGPK